MAERRTEERPQSIEISGEVLERITGSIGQVIHAPQETLRLEAPEVATDGFAGDIELPRDFLDREGIALPGQLHDSFAPVSRDHLALPCLREMRGRVASARGPALRHL